MAQILVGCGRENVNMRGSAFELVRLDGQTDGAGRIRVGIRTRCDDIHVRAPMPGIDWGKYRTRLASLPTKGCLWLQTACDTKMREDGVADAYQSLRGAYAARIPPHGNQKRRPERAVFRPLGWGG